MSTTVASFIFGFCLCWFSFATFKLGLLLDFMGVAPLVALIKIWDDSEESSENNDFCVKKIEPEPEEDVDARSEPSDSRNCDPLVKDECG